MENNLLKLLADLRKKNGDEIVLPEQVVKRIEKEKQKKKVLLVSTHAHQFTGYSKVSFNIVKFLAKKDDIELHHFGFQKANGIPPGYRPYPENVVNVDAAKLETPVDQGFAFKQLPDYIKNNKPDTVIIYNDALVVGKYLEEINLQLNADERRKCRIIVYLDQVYSPQRPALMEIIRREASVIFAFTDKWKKSLEDQLRGSAPKPPVRVLRHAFSSEMFFRTERERMRSQMNLPQDAFLMLNVNRNSPRKRYDILVRAFVELITRNPTKPIYLLCICDRGEKGGQPIFEIYANELQKKNIPVEVMSKRLMISSSDMSLPDSEINLIYNAADIGVTTTEGEGFGLCQLEQMGVGVPQVVPDIIGLNEFCNKDNSILVPTSHSYYIPVSMGIICGEAHAVDHLDYCKAVEKYLNDPKLREAHGREAKKVAESLVWDTELLPLYHEIVNA